MPLCGCIFVVASVPALLFGGVHLLASLHHKKAISNLPPSPVPKPAACTGNPLNSPPPPIRVCQLSYFPLIPSLSVSLGPSLPLSFSTKSPVLPVPPCLRGPAPTGAITQLYRVDRGRRSVQYNTAIKDSGRTL